MKIKLVPTFGCPSLCFRKLDVCLELGTFFSFDLVLGPVLGSRSDSRRCVGLRLPGAPGFPCETNEFALKDWHKPDGN